MLNLGHSVAEVVEMLGSLFSSKTLVFIKQLCSVRCHIILLSLRMSEGLYLRGKCLQKSYVFIKLQSSF